MKAKNPTLFDLPKTEEEKRLDAENVVWGINRPKPSIGDQCLVFSEEKYWNCRVTHVSKSGKSFWAATIDGKIHFRDIPVTKFKPTTL